MKRLPLVVAPLLLSLQGCHIPTLPDPGERTTIDFNGLPTPSPPSDGTVSRGCSYEEDGFTLDHLSSCVAGSGSEFKSIHPSNYRFSASVSLFNNTQLGITRLRQKGGGSFAMVSIDLDGLNGSATFVPPGGLIPYPEPATFTFVGTRQDGTVVMSLFTTDHNFPGRQTHAFGAAFDRVAAVTWMQDNGYPRPSQQFDNIVVGPATGSRVALLMDVQPAAASGR